MSTSYSLSISISGGTSSVVHSRVNAAPITLISGRIYGEDATVVQSRFVVLHTNNSSSPGFTPEKFNSRSPASSNVYTNTTSTANPLIQAGIPSFSHQSWIPSRKITETDVNIGYSVGLNSSASAVALSYCIMADESNGLSYRSIKRRTTRPGYFNRYGNEIHHHVKTGGSAFNQICPHFDNDVTWVDPSAWRNGMTQSDVWSIQSYGPQPRRRVNVT